MTALMGSSGAGKTTLLDVLANRKTGGKITGEILINGRKADPIRFSRLAGYVEQTDIHSPMQTVREALTFSAWLRLDRSLTKKEKEDQVAKTMTLLELDEIGDEVIGVKGAGLSVEQANDL